MPSRSWRRSAARRPVQESVDVCRAGLDLHPGYLSARVTLGRALIELDDLDTALAELEHVLRSAPENLAAIRGLAEIHHRQGALAAGARRSTARRWRSRGTIPSCSGPSTSSRAREPPAPPASADGLSFEQLQNEFLQHLARRHRRRDARAAAPL